MNFSELGRMIETLGKDRGIERGVVVNAIEQAFLVTARKKYGIQGEYETKYNDDDGEIEIFQYKNVVNDVRDPILEITVDDAKKLDDEADIGDQLGIKIENPDFTRVDVQTARQIIFQKVRDAEREILFSEYKHKEGELITGIARRYERGNIIVSLGKADAILPRRESIRGETFKTGDRVQAYLTEVTMTKRGPEIRLSRTSPLFLCKLFEMEVPEIQDGTITIKSAAREPGQRAKIAVVSADRDLDPVGACVGMKGSRVQNIVNELLGEKIDIVRWSDELDIFSRAALAPADITNIMFNYDEKSMDVVVDDEQLALAIGRRGQNVRLASMLTGFKVNIISKNKLQEKIQKSVQNLMQIPGLNEANAQVLVQNGVGSIIDLSEIDLTELSNILTDDEEKLTTLLANVKEIISANELVLQPEEADELISAQAVPVYDGRLQDVEVEVDEATKFSDAERRLREELAAFKIK